MVTELRVHGVSGTPAEEMLDRPILTRVAGDTDAGFFRPRPGFGDPLGPGGAKLEGYRWGNLTSGAAARALWLLLLPFMFANVAMWLHPVAGRRGVALVRGLCRIFALTITATYVLSAIGVSMDLIAWQCASTGNTCASHRSWLKVLAQGFFEPTGRRLALGALIPIAAIAGLWILGIRSWSRYESFPSASDTDGDELASSGFWNGRALVGRLRALHIATAFGTLDAVLAGVLAEHVRDPFSVALAVASGVVLLASLVAVCLPRMVDRDRDVPGAERFASAWRLTSITLTAIIIGYAMLARPPWPSTGGLPGYGRTVTGLFAAQCLLLAVLAIVVLIQRGAGGYLFGLGAPIIASFGLAIAAAFTAGLSFRVADFLDRSANPAMAQLAGGSAASRIAPPASYSWAALGFLGTLFVVVALIVGIRVFVIARLRRAARVVTDHDFPGGRTEDPKRASAIDLAIGDARTTDRVQRELLAVFLPLSVIAVGVTGLALAGVKPEGLAPAGGRAATIVGVLTSLGAYLVGLTALALLLLGGYAYRSAGLRRVVGVLWDLGTFWPRAAHPLAPPCYTERVVPELVARTTWLASGEADHVGPEPSAALTDGIEGRDGPAAGGGSGVILSGHSQGSVLVVAAILQLPPRVRARVALLTYGSPLRRLYAKLFPAYINDEVLADVGTGLGGPTSWINLWRDTDPIGGRIGAPADRIDVRDWRFVDPPAFGKLPGDTVYPAVAAHSDYPLDPGFADAVHDLRASLATTVPGDVPRPPAIAPTA